MLAARRDGTPSFGLARPLAVLALAILALLAGRIGTAAAEDLVREGLQIGAMGSLRMALPTVAPKFDLKYEFRNFNDSTAAMLAVEQGDIEVANTTIQHMVRAADEGIPVVWVAGWGGGYNVLVAAKSLGLKADDWKGLAALAKERAAAGKPLKIGVPTGSMQHLKLLVALREAGIDPDKGVDIVNIPFPTHPRALDGGDVDLAMTLATFGAMSINNGTATLFAHVFAGGAGKEEIGFIVRRDAVEKHPDLVERIVASHVAAMQSFADPEKQIPLELDYLKLPAPVVDMVQRDFLHLTYKTNLPDLDLMAREMHAVGWAKTDQSAAMGRLVNFSFLEKATGENKAALSHW